MNNNDWLKNAFKQIESKLEDVKVISLSTMDGFPVYTYFFKDKYKTEEDKLSAAASSMTALSLAAAKQFIGSSFDSTSIETKHGSMLLLKTQYEKKDCILCFISGNNHKIGRVRYFAYKLAEYIQNSGVSAE